MSLTSVAFWDWLGIIKDSLRILLYCPTLNFFDEEGEEIQMDEQVWEGFPIDERKINNDTNIDLALLDTTLEYSIYSDA